jgi:hypothetical protein
MLLARHASPGLEICDRIAAGSRAWIQSRPWYSSTGSAKQVDAVNENSTQPLQESLGND